MSHSCLSFFKQIKSEMLKEREAALEEQEVKLGAMLAQLQMEKAKEVSRNKIFYFQTSKKRRMLAYC